MTQAASIIPYGQLYRLVKSEPITYEFKLAAQTVNLTGLTEYTGAIFVVVKKKEELTLIEEKRFFKTRPASLQRYPNGAEIIIRLPR